MKLRAMSVVWVLPFFLTACFHCPPNPDRLQSAAAHGRASASERDNSQRPTGHWPHGAVGAQAQAAKEAQEAGQRQ